MILYCATTNPGKLREFRNAAGAHWAIEPLPAPAGVPAPEETGRTFEENASLKARYYGQFTRGMLIAEDSGLEVDALDGAPGISSARFAGADATDEQNTRLLLERMAGQGRRAARYVSVVTLVENHAVVRSFRGEVEGEILESPRGTGGFGYDPVFYYAPLGRTFAELTMREKATVSHRGKALADLFKYLASASNVT